MSRRPGWWPGSWPLAWQLAGAFALVTTLALASGGALLLQRLQATQLGQRAQTLQDQATVAVNLLGELRRTGTPEQINLALFRFHQQTGVRPVVVAAGGTVINDSWNPSPLIGQVLTQPEVTRALGGESASGSRRLAGGEWIMYAAVPLPMEPRPGALLVSADIGDVRDALAALQRQLTWVALVVGLLALALGVALARRLSRPLVRLSHAAAQLAGGEWSTRVSPGGSREAAELARSFNGMAADLGRLDGLRRAFVADASHELRTPVAAIRALAEALLADTRGDLARHQAYLADIVQECERSSLLVERLLTLAQLDARQEARAAAAPPAVVVPTGPAPADEPVDLAEAVAGVVQALQPLARQRGVQLTLLPPPPVTMQLDGALVESVLGNLVENALKYTPAGGQAQVQLGVDSSGVRLAVQDTGPGIAPEHQARIFERFYRVDRARSRATGGTGLGLAIAAEAAALLGGQIELTSTPGAGSCFTLVLPCRPDDSAL